MGQEQWSAVDEYVGNLLVPHDPALEAALKASEEAGLPAIQVSPPQGKLLNLLARSIGARAILEFGTLGGYSTIWLGRALPADGRLITLEAEPRYAAVVRDGTLAEASSDDPTVQAQRRLHETIAAAPQVSATTIQTVGGKGYDGFTLALVTP